MKALKTGYAAMVIACILSGCSPKGAPTPSPASTSLPAAPSASKVEFLWTQHGQGEERALGPESHPTPGQALTLHVATESQPARVVVAGFRDRALTMAPPPALVTVKAGQEQVVPWQVPPGGESSKLFTVFLPADGEASHEMEQVIAQCAQQNDGKGAAAQRLYDRLSEWAGEDRSGSESAGHHVVELGAALSTSLMAPEVTQKPHQGKAYDSAAAQGPSSNEAKGPPSNRPVVRFDWRESAREVSFGAEVHPVVIYDFATGSP